MHVFSTDTETFLIRPGVGAPPMVTLQFRVDRGPAELIHARDPAARVVIVWALTNALLNGHNIAYDMGVICAWAPDLIPLVFQAYEENRITCTSLRQKLADIAVGHFEGDGRRRWGYSLAECLLRMTGQELDKTDPWRLRYGTLWDTPVHLFPPDADHYARGDAVAQADLFFAQAEKIDPSYLVDQYRQSRAAFWLRLMECRGIRTDGAYVARYQEQTLAASEIDRKVAFQAGLVRANGKRDTKAAMARMVAIARELEEDFELTDAGLEVQAEMAKSAGRPVSVWEVWAHHPGKYVKLDEDACLASGDDILEAYQRFGSLKTTLSRLDRLYQGVHLPLQASFQPIVATGRTSCRMGDVKPGESPTAWGFQLQNLPRKG